MGVGHGHFGSPLKDSDEATADLKRRRDLRIFFECTLHISHDAEKESGRTDAPTKLEQERPDNCFWTADITGCCMATRPDSLFWGPQLDFAILCGQELFCELCPLPSLLETVRG